MTLTELDLLLGEFVYRTELFTQIHQTLHAELKENYTHAQYKLAKNFTTYFEDWWAHDVEYYKGLYHAKYSLDRMISEIDYQKLLY